VEVGPGTVIFAGVKIGDGAVIGPNVVVMSDIPPGARVFAEAPRIVRLPNPQGGGPGQLSTVLQPKKKTPDR
jgi:acetyltransferase-like isoleucine patch superfamily enzyme